VWRPANIWSTFAEGYETSSCPMPKAPAMDVKLLAVVLGVSVVATGAARVS